MTNARKEPYLFLNSLLGFIPNDAQLYHLALFNKSAFIKDKDGRLLNNERLEFLGDAVLSSVIAEILYHHFPTQKEGFLTLLRSEIVQRKSLNDFAIRIGLEKIIKDSKRTIGFNLLGNTLEALIGAIYLEKGYDSCVYFVKNKIIDKFVNLDQLAEHETNYKSRLLEWGAKNKITICFDSPQESVNKNLRVFQTDVYIGDLKVATAKASSKKESQQKASEMALGYLDSYKTIQKEQEGDLK